MTTAPDYLTWTGDVANGVNPYRPSVADMGGLDKENDAAYPPSPNEPSAEEWSQMVAQIAALAMVAPAARIDVRFAAGVPSVYAVYPANPGLVIADITVTDVGSGVVDLLIPATKIPDPRWGKLSGQETGNFGGNAYRSAAQTLRCEIFDWDSGAAADKNFVVEWG